MTMKVYVCVDSRDVDRTETMQIFMRKKDAEDFCKSMGTVLDWEIEEHEAIE